MKNFVSTLLLILFLNIVNAQIHKNINDSIPPMDNTAKGTWLKILYTLKDNPFKANDIIYLKANTLTRYDRKGIKTKYDLVPFKILYHYYMRCIKAPCPMGTDNVVLFYNAELKGSLKIQKGEFYFVDLFAVNNITGQQITEGKELCMFKGVVIKKPKKLHL